MAGTGPAGTPPPTAGRLRGVRGARGGHAVARLANLPSILRGIEERRKVVGDFEMNVAFRFGGTPFEVSKRGLSLFAKEVLPVLKSWKAEDAAKAAE